MSSSLIRRRHEGGRLLLEGGRRWGCLGNGPHGRGRLRGHRHGTTCWVLSPQQLIAYTRARCGWQEWGRGRRWGWEGASCRGGRSVISLRRRLLERCYRHRHRESAANATTGVRICPGSGIAARRIASHSPVAGGKPGCRAIAATADAVTGIRPRVACCPGRTVGAHCRHARSDLLRGSVVSRRCGRRVRRRLAHRAGGRRWRWCILMWQRINSARARHRVPKRRRWARHPCGGRQRRRYGSRRATVTGGVAGGRSRCIHDGTTAQEPVAGRASSGGDGPDAWWRGTEKGRIGPGTASSSGGGDGLIGAGRLPRAPSLGRHGGSRRRHAAGRSRWLARSRGRGIPSGCSRGSRDRGWCSGGRSRSGCCDGGHAC